MNGLGATRTSASCWYAAETSTPPNCPTTCPTSSARRCSTRGGGCRPRAGDRPDPRRRRPPHRPADAGAVAAELGVSQAGSVREAVDAGVVVLGGDGVWFRHPLLAGVLAESYLPGEAAPVHAAWAAHLESVPTDGVDELRRLGDLASHHERAGDGPAAFAALLQGADLAEKLGAPREAADLLARAADLWEAGADATDTVGRARLLERAGAGLRPGRAACTTATGCSARHATSSPPKATRSGRADCGAGGEVRVQPRRDPGLSTPRDRASRGALPGRARQPRARRGSGLPMPTSCTGPSGMTRHAGWSRRP